VPHGATERREPRRAALALERARIAAGIADHNRGKDILLLDLRQITPLVDYFVIITAGSRRQSHAIASEVDQEMKKLGEAKLGIEGSEEGRWTLIDYGDFVVHIFSPEDRAYYALEEIWGDAPKLDWTAGETPAPQPVPPAGESDPGEEAQAEPPEGPGPESQS
jgi:ribosome-associated protein